VGPRRGRHPGRRDGRPGRARRRPGGGAPRLHGLRPPGHADSVLRPPGDRFLQALDDGT
jgi:hypothetical protein